MAKLADAAHKALSPSTYECDLCRVTYGLVRMKRAWRDFVRALPVPVVFLHRDEFQRRHPELANIELPAAFASRPAEDLSVFIDARDLRAVGNLEQLQSLVSHRLRDTQPPSG
ncbi:MAG: hypothetical protein H0W70_03135 [Actinobacteria bacterium]|nr:hypothetical protein [Actinomycetota bacterium]